MALIGRSLEKNKGEKHNRWFRKLIENYEIFCHGYFHYLNEYKNTNLEEQISSILKNIKMARKVLGMSISTIGSLGNNISKNIKKSLIKTPINILLFGMECEINNLNQRNFEFKYSNLYRPVFKNRWLRYFDFKVDLPLNKRVPGNRNYAELVQRYKNVFNRRLIMGQIHPSSWSFKDLEELEKFLCFVIDRGEHQFISPKKFVEKQTKK